MSAREMYPDIEERTRRINAAVEANYMTPDLGNTLRESAMIQFKLHHAGNCAHNGNLSEAVENYHHATTKFETFREYLVKAQLTDEQRTSVLNSLEGSFSKTHNFILKYSPHEVPNRSHPSSGGQQ